MDYDSAPVGQISAKGGAMRSFVTLGVAAATLVSSMVGIPGIASTPLGVSEAHADGYYRRHRRHRDGFDFGDAVVGAIVAGGLIAVLSSASKKKREDDRPLDPASEPRGDWDRSRDGDWSWQDRDWPNRTNEERAAIAVCAREAEDLGSRYGGDARVREIAGVDREGGEYRVRGLVEARRDREGRDDDRGRNEDAFTCYVRNDRITDFRFSEDYAAR
jgi:hypothetical protein